MRQCVVVVVGLLWLDDPETVRRVCGPSCTCGSEDLMRRLCDSIHSKVESVRLVFFLGDKRCHRERLCRCEHVEWWMLA